jgi:nitrate/TMAO reductase-like tetraheme cytochrome c subunit
MLKRLRQFGGWLRRPSAHLSLGTLVLIGGVAALALWGGFSSVLGYSNSLSFCTSCHEMQAFVFQEYKQSPHYRNPSGVQATCADCHVARALVPKLVRKTRATFIEVPSHFMGKINTREKFEAKRLELAEHVWTEMRANDSRECRECHNPTAMALVDQKPRARAQHEDALKSGETCIDCHQGIAHKKPEQPADQGTEQEEDFSL